ncbi:hypothetical protein HK100_009143 [Physocladia obscura]|uniref:adenine phosphoribosyltransferase n=1 Tax=Physocladia obscura TaxID=109957 RepID=A0AAD5XF99_9FUNG|nr:hypothetical protein HK100_009143 [Physocladia obscura]
MVSAIDKTGAPLWDVCPVFASKTHFHLLTTQIAEHYNDKNIDAVLALDALGLPLGGAVATALQTGLILVRKGGKLNLPANRKTFLSFKDYPEKEKDLETLEVRSELIARGSRILVVDEWMGTGAQMNAAAKIVEGLGGVVAGMACLYCFPDAELNMQLKEKYDLWSANCLKCTYFECRCK